MLNKKHLSSFVAFAAVLIIVFCTLTPVFAGGDFIYCEKCSSDNVTVTDSSEYQETGNRYYHCNNCGHDGVDHEHKYGEEHVVEPTCIHPGSRYYICTVCGDHMGYPYEDALGYLRLLNS